jgi:hypothetical protein
MGAARADRDGRRRLSRVERLSVELLGVVRRLAYACTLEEVTAIVRRAVRQLTGADGATFVLREGDLVHYIDEDAIGPLWKGCRFDIQAGISGWTIVNRQAVAIPDIYADPRIPIEAYRTTFVKSLAMVPIRSEDPVGAIGAYWAKRRRASARQVAVRQALADAAALAFVSLQQPPAGVAPDTATVAMATAEPPAAAALPTREPFHRVIVIGASAGGVAALLSLLARLPADLSAPIFLVPHTWRSGASRLPAVLNQAGTLPAHYAQDGEPIRPGCVYVPPADHHLLVERGVLRVVKGVAENFARPAIDPLFRTAAVSYRQRVIGVLLSGGPPRREDARRHDHRAGP